MTKFICSKCGKEIEIKVFKDNICFLCKRKKTMIKKYGVENVFQLEKTKEKIKKTMNDKYGVDNPGQIIDNKKSREDKRLKTNKEKYGVDNLFKLQHIQEKITKTNIEKYGYKRAIQNEECKQKMFNTNIKKYGSKVPSQNKEIKEKIIASMNKSIINRGLKKKTSFISELFLSIKNVEPLFDMKEYQGIGYDNKYEWRCSICGLEFKDVLYAGHRPSCPCCFPKSKMYSEAEKEIVSWIKEFNLEVEENNREIISPRELDIFIPSHNLAIEFNGLYWHSDIYKDKNYHLNKTIECENQGIRLIHIFEDEWMNKQEIVKSRLKNILGFNSNRIGARKTVIEEINSRLKEEFLKKYHIQGGDKSSVKLGAYYREKLVGVMTFSKPRIALGQKTQKDKWELSRFATISDTYTPGLASKMLNYFEKNYSWNEIYSYADRRWSQGNLYENLGFNEKKFTGVNYWYWDGNSMSHRYKYRKNRLINFTNYSDDKTEFEIMDEAGYLRIHDCGNYKFTKFK